MTVRRMDDFRIYNELADFRSYGEYGKIHRIRKSESDRPILRKLTRKLVIEDMRITDSRMIITGPACDDADGSRGELCSPGDCIYTVREDSRQNPGLMEELQRDILSFIETEQLEIRGEAYASMLFMAGRGGAMRSYLEIFLPLKN